QPPRSGVGRQPLSRQRPTPLLGGGGSAPCRRGAGGRCDPGGGTGSMSGKKIRVLLVDDEEPARDRLRRLLTSFDWVEVIGEAEDGEQALEKNQELSPDLVFLDVQMPGAGGLEVAASLPTPGPGVI